MSRFRRWVAGIAVAFALPVAANFAMSKLVDSKRVSHLLTARLESSFGRPVQVGRYRFSFWSGPQVEADSVTVGEDPRFGHEYFLRAGQLGARLSLGSLLLGRVNFSSFSLSDASLNIVTVHGRWNLAGWLPPAPSAGRGGKAAAARLYRIEVDNGRINFKRGTVKLPFALVDVNGSVDETAPGQWSLSLEAQPLRAAVTLQDAGTLQLTGQVGGTSTRLRPARLFFRWQDASISDVLRLFFGYDYGIRGRQDLSLQTSSTGERWQFKLDARDSGLHRWDLAARQGNPGLSVLLAGSWLPGEGKLTLARGDIEGPSTSIALAGGLNWPVAASNQGQNPPPSPQFHLHLSTAGIGAEDLLSWYRSFHHAIPASMRAAGWLQGSADIDGWPPRLHEVSISALGLSAKGGALAAPVRLRAANLQASGRKVTVSLSGLDFGPRLGQFNIAGRARRQGRWDYRVEAAGDSRQVGDLMAAVEALGVRAPAYWSQFSGGAKIKIDWTGTIPFSRQTVLAKVDLRNAVWQEPSLPARVRLNSARIDASSDRLRFDIGSADALGASWHGWLERPRPSGAWRFSLAANELDARAVVARLRPQAQHPNLLERIFGFGHAAGLPPLWPASLDATGTMQVKRLQLAPLALDGLTGQVAIHHGSLELSPARARFYGGHAGGAFFFSVDNGVPVWRLESRLNGVNLAKLSRAFAESKTRFSGLAAGSLRISARGVTARSLLDSLEGQAGIQVLGARDRSFDWLATLEAGHAVSGGSAFERCSAQVRLKAGKLTVEDLSAVSRRGRVEATGGIDLAGGGTLAIEARFFPATGYGRPGSQLDARTYDVTGKAVDPLIRFLPSAEKLKPSTPSR
ncbi:MAG TPA: AsmA-like C-terminal region-containing protein [Candidatus Dormibacteraeota bacterium]|nr:AsmA-like C-terminal region-containing protein [Candidatus Dormibacteraeota bacterium]